MLGTVYGGALGPSLPVQATAHLRGNRNSLHLWDPGLCSLLPVPLPFTFPELPNTNLQGLRRILQANHSVPTPSLQGLLNPLGHGTLHTLRACWIHHMRYKESSLLCLQENSMCGWENLSGVPGVSLRWDSQARGALLGEEGPRATVGSMLDIKVHQRAVFRFLPLS